VGPRPSAPRPEEPTVELGAGDRHGRLVWAWVAVGGLAAALLVLWLLLGQ
jgi:hypothetical protein